jgi:hypothetical protein
MPASKSNEHEVRLHRRTRGILVLAKAWDDVLYVPGSQGRGYPLAAPFSGTLREANERTCLDRARQPFYRFVYSR